MADDIKQGATPQAVNPAPQGSTPAPDATDYRAKFEELNKSYEGLKGLEKYRELFPDATPEEVKQGVDWAVNIYKRVQAGELVEKGALQRPAPAPSPESNQPPWKQDGWDLMPASQQAEKLTEWNDRRLLGLVNAKETEFRKTLEGMGQLNGRSQSLLLKAIQAAIKNPQIDISTVLQKASEAAQMPAEAIIDQIVNGALNSPEAQEAHINKLVEERLAAKMAEKENERLNLLTNSSRPSRGLASAVKRTVADENKTIIADLAKKGIYLQ